MSDPGVFYVCDACGSIVAQDPVPEDGEWECDHCGSSTAWEFPPSERADAEGHAAHIRRLVVSRFIR